MEVENELTKYGCKVRSIDNENECAKGHGESNESIDNNDLSSGCECRHLNLITLMVILFSLLLRHHH